MKGKVGKTSKSLRTSWKWLQSHWGFPNSSLPAQWSLCPHPLPPCPSAQNMGCWLGECLAVECCLFLLRSLEVGLVFSVWSAWTSATWSLPCCLLSPALYLPQCRSCPCTGLLEHFASPPPPPHPPLPPDKVRCAKCPPVRLVCILEKIPGVEPALRPRLVRSFSCYTVQVALHPGFLSFDLL